MKKLLINLMIGLSIVAGGTTVFAENTKTSDTAKEEQVGSPNIPYNVVTKIPENQINKQASYYDILVKPGQKQTFTMEIMNGADKEVDVIVEPITARTSQNGTVTYLKSKEPLSKTMKYSFEDLVSKKQTVKLPARGKKNVTFTATMPDQTFEGMLLGGFNIREVDDEKDDQNNVSVKEGMTITNKYSIVVAAQIRMDEKAVVKQNFSIEDVKVAEYGGSYSIFSELSNDSGTLIGGYTFDATITDKDGDAIYKWSNEGFQMAPNSVFVIPQKVSPDTFPAGDYKLDMTVYSPDGKQKWPLEKKFTIDRKERKKVLDTVVVDKGKDNSTLMYVLIAIGIMIIILGIVTIVMMKRKNGKDANN
ncbi:DUF916 and DUF3324 domain-containing protein [Vagococcus xieshaowenii]|uniref:DUF916 and DUF3324 domain-containing protein n=1 Tax=Vagococcus xieshaowenii TaxID=2562451 RepID=A0A4Z0D9G2_9ENTE|nr:DUF916 and DUF3324 domain-containing protein [Vagococcus xieshaowenii]QCA29431.1 DUF916 and DUF3324 domain-containing protein [Vagococcus xieshaowenii]TFZ41551.1 DUF916 and DUF3324 domain-containing protein [Vagococcus xieshaowenii]